MSGVTEKMNLVEVVKSENNEEILKRRIKRLVQECFENPSLNEEVLVQFLNKKIEWSDDLKNVQTIVEGIQTAFFKERKDVRIQVKRFIQQCFESPELNYQLITRFLNRKIDWITIKRCLPYGTVVTCKLCGETSLSEFWCKPCVHRDWCCFCCILLGFPFYR